MASVGIVINQHIKECRNYCACLKRINFNNLVKSMRLSICLPYIKYQVFTSKKIQDFNGYGYILLCLTKR